jgi:Domain of unknown function (DUF4386)
MQMAATLVNGKSTATSAVLMARIAGAMYMVNIVTSLDSYFGPRNRLAHFAGLVAAAAYIAVTVLFYFLFKPVSHGLSLLAAGISLAASAIGILQMLGRMPFRIELMVFFSWYCLLIGYLILRATFLPHFLGVLMILAGIGYTAYFWPHFAKALFPYDVIPGALGEWTLTVWLLVKGVNGLRWAEQAAGIKELKVPDSFVS